MALIDVRRTPSAPIFGIRAGIMENTFLADHAYEGRTHA